MENLFSYLATFLGGATLTHLWERFIRRITTLRYTVVHQSVAFSADDAGLGQVKVIYNEMPVKNIYFTTLEVSNETNRDLANLELNISCDKESLILKSQAINKSSSRTLFLTDKYSKLLLDEDPSHTRAILSYREYLVPVLNRGDTVQFTMIATNDAGRLPMITAFCDHLGVRLKFQKQPPQKLFGESQSLSVLVGFLLTMAVCYLIILFRMNLSSAVWYSYVLGAVGGTIGAFALKGLRYLRRVFT
jgi:hypothetical protein